MNTSAIAMYDRSRAFAEVVRANGGSPLRILIGASEKTARTKQGQVIITALCDILPRISERYVRIDLCLPPATYLLSEPGDSPPSMVQVFQSRLRAICSWGEFSVVSTPQAAYDFCISVGEKEWPLCHQTLYAHSRGWRCFVSSNPDSIDWDEGDFNPFACLATAALAAMMVYAKAESIDPSKVSQEVDGWSLLDFSISTSDGPPLPSTLNLGTVVQAGLGGSANALLWGLRYGPALRGRWVAFEHELLDLTNANRYLLVTPADAGLPKALVARREFACWQPLLQFNAVQGRIEDSWGNASADSIALATVDDEAIRVHLQQQYPALLLNVGTASQYLSLSRHPLSGMKRNGVPCAHCLYREPQSVERRQRESTVSFVTALVGALLGAELVKAVAFPEYALRYAWLGSVFQPTAASPYLPVKFFDCPTCSILKEG